MPAPLVGAAVAAAARLAAKKLGQEAAKKTAKKVASKATDKIAKNSVKTVPSDNILRARKNLESTVNTIAAKSGGLAKRDASFVKTKKMGTIKVNSAPAKSADAAKKSADAKALKAANKKKK
jgi:hypothetical protein